ncbi:MAG: methylated-DNA--[protein]-cysteine S-methyltransferase [Candidatus Bipolaricaulota bacterium]|nr:MAG: methylated-DNA--[protein]-cysteine S-methyltransferase [Candidatus Bipolaricaulota bacterium]
MARRTKLRPERLYGSVIGWEGWTFRILSSPQGLRRLELHEASFDDLAERLGVRILPDDSVNAAVLRQLHDYLEGERRAFDLALDLRGTEFQRAVWDALRGIPYGETRAYGDVAKGIGRPRAARAVGQALASNPVPIIVPCHRVLGGNGSLVGFGGGLPLKERLLALEKGSLQL